MYAFVLYIPKKYIKNDSNIPYDIIKIILSYGWVCFSCDKFYIQQCFFLYRDSSTLYIPLCNMCFSHDVFFKNLLVIKN